MNVNYTIVKWALCGILAIRIFLFNAAFPFWNNVDEQAHFDTVVKYSRGYVPRQEATRYDPESLRLIVLHQSPEYLNSLESSGLTEWPPPLWQYERSEARQVISGLYGTWEKKKNHEAFSPPVYYGLAGIWYNIGKLAHLEGIRLLYWVRFLNIPMYIVLFWLTSLFCRRFFENAPSMQLGVLLLVTFFPQDVFFSINSDVLSPLLSLAALLLAFRIYDTGGRVPLYVFTGMAFAATLLTKLSNLPLWIIFAFLVVLVARKALRGGNFTSEVPKLLLLVGACVVPVLFWLAWNAHALGDITGSAEKTRILGWTVKPLTDMLDHPVFSLFGLVTFISELLKTFWRGEFLWETESMSSAGMDLFYVTSSCLFVTTSIVSTFKAKDSYSHSHRLINVASAIILVSYLALFAVLSIVYDFGSCWYPSKDHPYFTSGRLALGGLIPILVLYMDGLRILTAKLSRNISPIAVVLAICFLMMFSEINLTYPVFKSAYNWFHM